MSLLCAGVLSAPAHNIQPPVQFMSKTVQKHQSKNAFLGSAREAGTAGPTVALWETTMGPSGSGGIQGMREEMGVSIWKRNSCWKSNSCWVGVSPRVTADTSVPGLWCQVHLGQGGAIQKPEHPPTPTSGWNENLWDW